MFASNSPGELHVFGHDGNAFGVNGAEVGVFKQPDQISFTGFLKSRNSLGLEPKPTRGHVLGDFLDQALKWQLAYQQFGRLLKFANFTKGHNARAIAMRFLGSVRGGCIPQDFARGLWQFFAMEGNEAIKAAADILFGSRHCVIVW